MMMTRAEEFAASVAANIRAERARIGIGQEVLAQRMRKLGFDAWIRQTVGSVEQGKRRVTVDELLGLAECLGCHMISLIGTPYAR